jgi:hypothetical protein
MREAQILLGACPDLFGFQSSGRRRHKQHTWCLVCTQFCPPQNRILHEVDTVVDEFSRKNKRQIPEGCMGQVHFPGRGVSLVKGPPMLRRGQQTLSQQEESLD